MPAPAWVKARADAAVPVIDIDVVGNRVYANGVETTGSITSVLTGSGPYINAGAWTTFLNRTARTILIETVGGDGAVKALISPDGQYNMLHSTSATNVVASTTTGDLIATLGSSSFATGNTVKTAVSSGASGVHIVANNGVVVSGTGLYTAGGATNGATLKSKFGDWPFNGTLTRITGWDDGDRIAGADLAGLTVAAAGAYTLTAASGTFALAGVAPTLRAARKVMAAQRTFSLTGIAAALRMARKLVTAAGMFSLTGFAANLVKAGASTYRLTTVAGAFVLTGIATGLRRNYAPAPAAGIFDLTFNPATLTWSGAPIWTLVSTNRKTWTVVAANSEAWTPVPTNPGNWT